MPKFVKPDGEKRSRTPLVFGWSELPEQHDYCPPLPRYRRWHAETRRLWAALWAKPQAAMWDQSGSTLRAYILLWDDVHTGAATVAAVSAELRQHEDKHGLNPKSMLQLRWRVVASAERLAAEAATAATSTTAAVASLDQRRRVLERMQKQGAS